MPAADDQTRPAPKRWFETTYAKATLKRPERKPAFETSSGIELHPTYAPEPLPADWDERIGWPGEPPYTRGVQPTMYRGRFWTMRQYAGFATAAESNRRYRALLEQGQTGLSVAFDLPTQIGYDPDHVLSLGEVGRVGVSIAHLADMETLLDGIPLEKVSISMTINSTAIVLLSLLLAVAKKRGVDPSALRGTLQNDMFKEFVARGTQRLPPRPSLRVVVDVIEYATKNMPKFNPISISGYHIREAGSTAVEEVAFTLADAIGYVEAARDRGLDVDHFAGRLSFFFNAHNNLLEEVAKYRAARRLWERIMRERFGAKDAAQPHASLPHPDGRLDPPVEADRRQRRPRDPAGARRRPRRHAVAPHQQPRRSPLASVGGGRRPGAPHAAGDRLRVGHGRRDRPARRRALRRGVDRRDRAARRGADRRRSTQKGGTLAAIEAGFPQSCIEKSAYDAQRRQESGEDVVVGVNRFEIEGDRTEPEFRLDPEAERHAVERLAAFRAARDEQATQKTLTALAAACETDANLVESVLAAVEAHATIGEIMQVLEDRWGTFRAPKA